jgi:hypothetical protein
MAWTVTAAFLVWFIKTLDVIPIALFIIGVGIIFREEVYVRQGLDRKK